MIGKLLILFVSAHFAVANPAADQLTQSGIAEFTSAYQKWDGAGFRKAADSFDKAKAANPESSVHPTWLGVARFHEILHKQSINDQNAAKNAMDGAIQALEFAIKIQPVNPEAHAILSTIYGMKIQASPISAIRFGPSVMKHKKAALQHGPSNPRVRYLIGAGLFHTAKDDASRHEALTSLLAAEKLFQAEAKIKSQPLDHRWGHSACLTFIARTYESLQMPKEAKSYYNKTLTLHPSDHTAKAALERLK